MVILYPSVKVKRLQAHRVLLFLNRDRRHFVGNNINPVSGRVAMADTGVKRRYF